MNKRFLLALICTLGGSVALMAADADLFRINPAKVLGAENCAECHAPMVEAWKLTHHFDTFNSMHRRPEAAEISKKMGLRRIKSESICIKCHYTAQADGDTMKPISGISCESCHNAGADWNKIHSNKDDPDRLAKGEKLGMIRPSNTYHVAANCYSCHTVPEEKLVNEGGHTAGSDFELVAWSQGEIRHNMQKDPKKNVGAPDARKRMFYILGRSLDLEYGLRGLAKATQPGKYADSMIKRVNNAVAKLKEIQNAAKLDEVAGMVAAVDAGQLKPGNAATLSATAEKVAALAMKLAAANDGSKLAAVDSLLPSPDAYKGKVYQP